MNILLELFIVFFKLGAFTIGGGIAMLPLLQNTLINEKKWFTKEEFMDIVAVCQSLPGVVAINMATYVGYKKKGLIGSIVSTFGVTIPSFIMILIIAKFITSLGDNGVLMGAMAGLRAAALGMVVVALIQLMPAAIKNKWAMLAAIVAVIATSLYNRASTPPLPGFEVEQTRRQIIGDAAIIDKGIATGWSDVFPDEGDRFFASFAIPGVKAGQRNTTVKEIDAALHRNVEVSDSDGMETRQVKSMVAGMKAEARAYIAAGGSIVEYGKRLTERQDAEIAIYERAKSEIDRARKTLQPDDFLILWEERNDQLRNLGIKLVPLE